MTTPLDSPHQLFYTFPRAFFSLELNPEQCRRLVPEMILGLARLSTQLGKSLGEPDQGVGKVGCLVSLNSGH